MLGFKSDKLETNILFSEPFGILPDSFDLNSSFDEQRLFEWIINLLNTLFKTHAQPLKQPKKKHVKSGSRAESRHKLHHQIPAQTFQLNSPADQFVLHRFSDYTCASSLLECVLPIYKDRGRIMAAGPRSPWRRVPAQDAIEENLLSAVRGLQPF